jgi:rubredoxin
MIKCKVCGHEFQPVLKNHYVSRDCDESGVVTVFKSNEVKLYDSFDCPACGCQSIPQERKRVFISCIEVAKEVEEDEACEEAETD